MTLKQVYTNSLLPRRETEILLAFLLNKRREFLLTYPETIVPPLIYKRFKALEKKRRANWPISYLTGHKEFYGLDFKVTPAVLTPRPETEMIVEEILKIDLERSLMIDLGTGSGAIIIACAKNLKNKSTQFLAVDISRPALNIARQNANLHGLNKKIKFYQGNLLTPIRQQLINQNLIISANLPYLTSTQVKKAPSISREPRVALIAGSDGLKYYRILFKQLSAITYESLTLLCEIDPGQKNKILALSKKYFFGAKIEIKKDLAGKHRLAVIKVK